MNLNERIAEARKRSGLTQEEVADRLCVSRQTVSRWEQGTALPDLEQAQTLAQTYGVSLNDLAGGEEEVARLQRMIERTDERVSGKVDWTKVWSKRYPVLASYQKQVDIGRYADALSGLIAQLQREYGYNRLDAMLVLKDILAHVWKGGE